MINFNCSGCGANLNIGDEWAGKLGQCPHCGVNSRVPGYPKRTPRTVIISRFAAIPLIAAGGVALLLGWPVFLGGLIGISFFIFFAWAFTNVVTWVWCKADGSSRYLRLWKAGGGDPFFDTLDSPLNNDPPSVRFQELYREKLRQECEGVNGPSGSSPGCRTNNCQLPGINDPNIIS